MIQVYKKNELFIIENTVTDIIYPNLTREETIVLLKKFDRKEPEHRCDFAIKEDNISFEYASLDDKDKTIAEQRKQIADLEAKLAEMTEKYNACQEARKIESEFSQQDKKELMQQLAESEAYIQGNIPKLIEANKMMSKQLADKDTELCNMQAVCINAKRDSAVYFKENIELREQLAEKEKEIEELWRKESNIKKLSPKEVIEKCEEKGWTLSIYNIIKICEECKKDKITYK